MNDRQPPELTWRDLNKGDRVSHLDYGTGVVDSSGPHWIYITWDNPDEHLNHHTAAIARHLTALDRQVGEPGDQIEIGRASCRERVSCCV